MGLDDNEIRRLAQLREADEALDDYNAELSGTKSGYTYRTSAADHENRQDIRAQKARSADAKLSALQALLDSDPAYRALYEDTQNKVNEAGTRAEAALEKAEAALAEAEQELSETEDNAARTQEGRLAFKGADGKIYDHNGQVIEGVEADSIVWPSNAPTYEEYLAKKDALAEARKQVVIWQEYLLLIGEARDRMNDPGNPPSADELTEWQTRLKEQDPSATASEFEPEKMTIDTSFSADKPKL